MTQTPNQLPHPVGARARRLLPLAVALAMLSLAVVPQCALLFARGRAWQGSFSYFTTDERAYAAYVNALADARPRLSDPYTGRDARAGAPQGESLFSVQFVPAYALASVERVFHLRTDACFFALLCTVAVIAPLLLFRLIRVLTGDARLAAAGALCVLCLGALAAGNGVWSARSIAEVRFRPTLFLRLYQPAFAFPLFFIFCLLVRRALAGESRRLAAAALAGLVFAALVFTYFFYWTAAAAWLACLAALWAALRRDARRDALRLVAVVALFAVAALVPYFVLLSRRAATVDAAQVLTLTRAPDFLRLPELIGYAVLAALAFAWRRVSSGDANAADATSRAGGNARPPAAASSVAARTQLIFAASFALLPVPLFNQQLVTGRSLQPFHYDIFVANYCVLLAVVLAAPLVLRRKVPARVLVACALAAYLWGFFEVAVWVHRSKTSLLVQDELPPVAARLRALRAADGRPDTESVIFAPTFMISDLLPTYAPQPVLWSAHLGVFSGASQSEERERLLQYFYYQNIDLSDARGRDYQTLDRKPKYYLLLLLTPARVNPYLGEGWQPVTTDETARAVDSYADFARNFSRDDAARPVISYVLVYDYEPVDLSNLDRFYERDAGERVGHFTLYRVRLKDKL